MNEPEVVVLPDAEAVADAAADRVVAALRAAIAARGEAHLGLTGGSSAAPLYARLAGGERRDAVPWSAVTLWWDDERYVPRDHPASNAGLVEATLLRSGEHDGQSGDGGSGSDVEAGIEPGVAVPAANVHPFPVAAAIAGDRGAPWAAAQYAAELRRRVPADAGGWPILDLILLGVGADGHILSCFPGSPALADDAPLALAVPAPTAVEPHLPRLTLNPRVVAAARGVLVMASGAGKAAILRQVLVGPRDVRRLPAQYARRVGATWLLDRAAAGELREGR